MFMKWFGSLKKNIAAITYTKTSSREAACILIPKEASIVAPAASAAPKLCPSVASSLAPAAAPAIQRLNRTQRTARSQVVASKNPMPTASRATSDPGTAALIRGASKTPAETNATPDLSIS